MIILAIAGVVLTLAGVGSGRVIKGLSMIDVAPKGTGLNKFLNLRLSYFATYPFEVMTKRSNYASEDVQLGFAMLHNQVRAACPHVASTGDEFYWMHGSFTSFITKNIYYMRLDYAHKSYIQQHQQESDIHHSSV